MRIAGRVPASIEFRDDGPSLEKFTKMVRLADRYGYTKIWPGGSGMKEEFSLATYVATITNRVKVGARVVDPLNREPGVVANALAIIHAISGGRAFLVLGRGDGIVRKHGFKEATVQQVKEYYLVVRKLLDEGETEFKGRTVRFNNAGTPPPFKGKDRIPLYIITAGPRLLKVAGAIADGIWVGAGLTREIIDDAMARIREGAAEAGRDPSEIDIWWVTRSSVERTHEAAMDRARESVASIGNHSLRGGFEGKRVPEELQPKIQRYHELYDWREKGTARGNVKLMEELGLTDYFIKRFAVVGTPDEVVARLRYLQTLGINQCELAARNPDTLRLIGEEVIPAVT